MSVYLLVMFRRAPVLVLALVLASAPVIRSACELICSQPATSEASHRAGAPSDHGHHHHVLPEVNVKHMSAGGPACGHVLELPLPAAYKAPQVVPTALITILLVPAMAIPDRSMAMNVERGSPPHLSRIAQLRI